MNVTAVDKMGARRKDVSSAGLVINQNH